MAAKKLGRPTKYNEKVCDEICTRLAGGESLRSICRDDKMPAISSVLLWVVDGKHSAFSEQYTQAREAQGYSDADRIREIAAAVAGGEIEAQAARVIIDAYKWTAERNAGRAFGNKQQVDHRSSDRSMSPTATQDAVLQALRAKHDTPADS